MPAIAFDMGGVLLTDGSQTAWVAMEERFGLPALETERIWYDELQRPGDLGEISEDDMWERLCSLLPGREPSEVRQVFLDEYQPIDQGIEALRSAHAAGWQVLLATNNVGTWVDYWMGKYDWMRLPSGIICSSEIGVRKPDPEFYESVRIRIEGDPSYFVDDKVENLEPAISAGFRPVHATAHGVWPLPRFE